jgi:acetyl-CoA carboxylase carboxyltransferase component
MSKKNTDKSLDILNEKLEQTLKMGGAEKILKQHSLKRLTARERIQKLLDRGSFFEMGQLAHSDLPEVKSKTPADGKICGLGTIEGRKIGVSADDVTVMAGAGGRIGYQKEFKIHSYAVKKGYPSIHLGDGGGARIPDIMGATGMMTFTYDVNSEPRSRKTPLITTIMGDCFGGPTWKASNSDVVIQVKGAVMAVSGPPVLEAATGEKVSSEELGGWQMHAEKSGLVDLIAENDADALRLVKKVLTYLPNNYKEFPSVTTYDENFKSYKQEKLLHILPQNQKMSYDMHEILQLVFDKNSLLEFKAQYDGSLITALARLEGQVVGVLANNPKVYAGAMGPGACEKATSFIVLCDSFHIPLIFLHDTPGFYVSKAAEERQMPIKIMNFIKAIHYSTVPRIALIIRKSYGMAHCNMVGANMGADFMLAWPNAEISFMAPEVAMNVMLGRKIKESTDPEALKQAFMEEMNKMNAPWEAAGLNLIDKIIDPRDTRKELRQALKITSGASKNYVKSKRLMANWPKML